MKLFCLSAHPSKPCYILRVKDVTLMLDCSLVTQTVLNFLPLSLVPSPRLSNLLNYVPRNCPDPQVEGELKDCDGRVFVNSAPEFSAPLQKLVDFSEIDAILISNYMTMLALPYITEGTGFHGVVYMTEPTLIMGRLFLEELVEYLERTPKPVLATHWKEVLHTLPPPLCESMKPRSWQQIFSRNAVASSLTKVQTLNYEQELDTYGTLKIIPVGSGYCLGSCNWVIKSDYHKLVYASGSSALTTHPRAIKQDQLKNADILFLTGLTQSPSANPDSALGELCMNAAMTLRNNGNVLIPCYPSGVVYDLFECLSSHLDGANLSNIPMYFISPVSNQSLGFSNILAEWVSDTKQNKVFLPEEPFPHAHLIRCGRLKPVKHIYDDGFCNEIRQPCVVFCGHPSLRFGDSVHFIELWGSNPANTVIFTEPEYNQIDALAPFQPIQMKFVHCPIDTSLNYAQANKLIRDLKPSSIILPESYPFVTAPISHRTDLAIEQPSEKTEIHTIRRGEVLALPLKRRKVIGKMPLDLVYDTIPVKNETTGRKYCSFTAILDSMNNNYQLKEIKSPPDGVLKPASLVKHRKHEWGRLDIQKFIRKLNERSIKDVRVERTSTGCIIHLENEDTLIQTEGNCTHIFCEASDKNLRQCLRTALMECFSRF